MLRSLVVLMALVTGVAACSLDEGGLATDDAGGDAIMVLEAAAEGGDDAGTDGGADVGPIVLPDASPGCDAGATDLLVTTAAGCPLGTTTESFVTAPVASAGACGCAACTATAQPACAGNLTFGWGVSNACGAGSWNMAAAASCTAFQSTFNAIDYNYWSKLAPTPGTCTATPDPHLGQVTTTQLTRCVISAQTPDVACAAEQAGGYRLCVPYGAGCSGKYSASVDVGTAPTLTCAACSCALTAAACAIEYYGDSNCAQLNYTRLLDGKCTATSHPQGNSHFKTRPTDPTCATSPGAPTVGLANATRMCCTP